MGFRVVIHRYQYRYQYVYRQYRSQKGSIGIVCWGSMPASIVLVTVLVTENVQTAVFVIYSWKLKINCKISHSSGKVSDRYPVWEVSDWYSVSIGQYWKCIWIGIDRYGKCIWIGIGNEELISVHPYFPVVIVFFEFLPQVVEWKRKKNTLATALGEKWTLLHQGEVQKLMKLFCWRQRSQPPSRTKM